MGTSIFVDVYCDKPKCKEWTRVGVRKTSIRDIRADTDKYAKEAKWVKTPDGLWYCPEHAPKKATK